MIFYPTRFSEWLDLKINNEVVKIKYKFLPTYMYNKKVRLSFTLIDKFGTLKANENTSLLYATISEPNGRFYINTIFYSYIRFSFKNVPLEYIGKNVLICLEILND